MLFNAGSHAPLIEASEGLFSNLLKSVLTCINSSLGCFLFSDDKSSLIYCKQHLNLALDIVKIYRLGGPRSWEGRNLKEALETSILIHGEATRMRYMT